MTLFAWKWNLWRIKIFAAKIFTKVLVPQTTAFFMSRVSKSFAPFSCNCPMVMHFVPILHRRRRSKPNFYVFSYDKTSLKFCASFRFFLAVLMDKFKKIHSLKFMRRGIGAWRYILMRWHRQFQMVLTLLNDLLSLSTIRPSSEL